MERAAIAANRVGKTTMSAFETTLHLTGRYPEWWGGRRFDHPVEWWAASDTGETTRDILQLELMGKIDHLGTGMIPLDCIIGEPSRRRGVADAIDTVRVRHVSGGESSLSFKSYDQGREKFQGTKKHGISLDEEPDMGVYSECLTRLMATVPGDQDGTMLCTFTPLKGMSAVVLSFLNDPNENRFVLTFGFDDAPHLSEESKAKLLAAFPVHERDARSKGTSLSTTSQSPITGRESTDLTSVGIVPRFLGGRGTGNPISSIFIPSTTVGKPNPRFMPKP